MPSFLAQTKGFAYDRIPAESLQLWAIASVVSLSAPIMSVRMIPAALVVLIALATVPHAIRAGPLPPTYLQQVRAAVPGQTETASFWSPKRGSAGRAATRRYGLSPAPPWRFTIRQCAWAPASGATN